MQLEDGTFQTKNRQSCRVPCHEDSQERGVQQDLQRQWASTGTTVVFAGIKFNKLQTALPRILYLWGLWHGLC